MASGPMSISSPSENLVPPPLPADGVEPKHGGSTRFEIELEFVQSLANPQYLNHLASRKFLSEPAFVNYLAYLQYWTRPPYLKYLTYPGPTIKHLELLQEEKFRQEIISPELVNRLMEEGMRAGIEHHPGRDKDMDRNIDEPYNDMGGRLEGAFDDEINNTEEIATSVTLTGEEEVSSDNNDNSICGECLDNEFNSIVGQACVTCLNRKFDCPELKGSSDEEKILGQPTRKSQEETASIESEAVEGC